MAVTGFRFPTAESLLSGNWSNLPNIRAKDGAVAQCSAATQTITFEADALNFGFSIPSASTISKVELEVKCACSNTTAARQEVQAVVGGALVGAARVVTSAPQSNPLDTTFDITADRAWSADDFSDANFKVRCRAITTSNTSRAFDFDCVSVQVTYTAPPAVTGTLGATEAADTASMAGTVTGNAGRLIATEAPDAAAFAAVASGYRQSVQVRVGGVAVGGRQENATALAPVDQEFDITAARAWTPADFRDGTFAVYLGSHAPDAPFEGHWDATAVRITYVMPPNRTGIVDAVEAADVAAFVGVGPPVVGTLAATEAADLAAFVGKLVTQGALVGIEAADVALWQGTVASRGTLAATEAPDVAALTGTVQAKGTLAATEAADVAAFAAKIVGTGTLAATEAADAAAFTGGVVVGGTLAATDAPDRAAFNGAGVGVNGDLDATDAPDVAVFAAKVATVGTLAASEASDLAAFAGEAVAILGTLAATDAPDVAAFAGGTTGTGIVVATEGADVALFTAKATVSGTLAATEAADAALVVGGVAWVGTLAASEAPDVAAITGTVRLAGTLAAVEAPDAAAFAGAIIVSGALDATEAPDEAAFFQTSIAGFFAALEASDNAIILATGGDYAVDIVGDEDPHTIHGGCEGVSTIIGTARTPTIKGSV